MNPMIDPLKLSYALAHQFGDRPALVDIATNRAWSYEDLFQQTQRWKAYLHQSHVMPGDVVIWVAKNSIDFFAVLFAAKELGITLLPLNWRESNHVQQRIVDLAKPALILYEPIFEKMLTHLQPLHKAKSQNISLIELHDIGNTGIDIAVTIDERTPWYLLFTSGTTGDAKAVIYNWNMHVANVKNVQSMVDITPSDINLSVLPHYHTAGINLFALPTLMLGGSVRVHAEANPIALLKELTNESITTALFIPTLFQKIADLPEFKNKETLPNSFKLIASGGAPLIKALWVSWQAKGVVIQNGCGLTESGPTLFLQTKSEALNSPTAVGQVVKYTQVKLIGPDGSEVHEGEAGEIWIRGAAVTPGYWRSVDHNRAAFKNDWFRTGDVAVLVEGQYQIVDRMNDLFICGGECVYPSEIEQMINRFDGVEEVVVMGEPHRIWGETGVALVVCKPGYFLTQKDVLAFCKENLARYKVPKRIEFIDELPKTATGKIRRGLVRNWVRK